jgi:hypothetical protein
LLDAELNTPESVIIYLTRFRAYIRQLAIADACEIVRVEMETIAPRIYVSQGTVDDLLAKSFIERIAFVGSEGNFFVLSAEGWRLGRRALAE